MFIQFIPLKYRIEQCISYRSLPITIWGVLELGTKAESLDDPKISGLVNVYQKLWKIHHVIAG